MRNSSCSFSARDIAGTDIDGAFDDVSNVAEDQYVRNKAPLKPVKQSKGILMLRCSNDWTNRWTALQLILEQRAVHY
jgi:hypothetical protein